VIGWFFHDPFIEKFIGVKIHDTFFCIEHWIGFAT
jgi:hypothetical protein